MRSPRRMPRKRPGEKALTFRMAVRASTTRLVVGDTHHQDRANMLDNKQPSNNGLEEDHAIWDPREQASDAEAGPIGRAAPTAPDLERMNPQMV